MTNDIIGPIVETVLKGFVKQKPSGKITLMDADNELEWLRTELTAALQAVQRNSEGQFCPAMIENIRHDTTNLFVEVKVPQAGDDTYEFYYKPVAAARVGEQGEGLESNKN